MLFKVNTMKINYPRLYEGDFVHSKKERNQRRFYDKQCQQPASEKCDTSEPKSPGAKGTGLFTAEGTKMFLEAPDRLVEKVYVSESLAKDEKLMDRVGRFSHETVTDPVFRQMSDTMTPQGILTVLKKPSYKIEDILNTPAPLVMVLEDIQDPGNAGTIIRTGEGAGVSGIILTHTSVDVFNPKVIRATMGSIYRIPFLYVEDVVSLKQTLKERRIRSYAAHLKAALFMIRRTIQEERRFL